MHASSCARFLASWITLVLSVAAAAAPAEETARAEALGLVIYHEGFPPELAGEITPVGAERLAELLGDPAQARFHATLIEALAHSAHPGAYEAIARYAPPSNGGQTGTDGYRALRARPVAMGHLARSDDRALDWLLESLESDAVIARVRGRSADRVNERLRRQALYGLGLSGRPQALPALQAASSGQGAAARAARRGMSLHSDALEGNAP